MCSAVFGLLPFGCAHRPARAAMDDLIGVAEQIEPEFPDRRADGYRLTEASSVARPLRGSNRNSNH